MAWDLAVIRPGDTPYGIRHMRMEAAPIPRRAAAAAGFIVSRRNEPIDLVMATELKVPQVGLKAPEFFIDTTDGRFSLHQLAARHRNLILTSQDSYRYHPN
jgi:hypothetical protein